MTKHVGPLRGAEGGRMVRRPTTLVAGMATAALVGALVAGCSPTEAEPSVVTTSPTATSTPTPTETGAPDEAAILDTYRRYWAAVVAAQRGNPDPALFEGVATGPLVEEWVGNSRELKENGLVREGEPGFAQITVEQESDAATVFACVDFAPWIVADSGGEVPGVIPGGITVTRTNGAWLVTGEVEAPGDFTC